MYYCIGPLVTLSWGYCIALHLLQSQLLFDVTYVRYHCVIVWTCIRYATQPYALIDDRLVFKLAFLTSRFHVQHPQESLHFC